MIQVAVVPGDPIRRRHDIDLASRTRPYSCSSGRSSWNVTTPGAAAIISSTDPVAMTPSSARPTSSPASLPIFSGE